MRFLRGNGNLMFRLKVSGSHERAVQSCAGSKHTARLSNPQSPRKSSVCAAIQAHTTNLRRGQRSRSEICGSKCNPPCQGQSQPAAKKLRGAGWEAVPADRLPPQAPETRLTDSKYCQDCRGCTLKVGSPFPPPVRQGSRPMSVEHYDGWPPLGSPLHIVMSILPRALHDAQRYF